MMRKSMIGMVTGIFVSGCAATAHLYPANEIAATTGVIEVHYTASGTGYTRVMAAMPDGEILNGEATIVRGGSVGFGTIFASVQGNRESVFGSGTNTTINVPIGNPGQASLFGTKGTSMQCEYYDDSLSGHGYGGCRSSRGALYRLQY